MRLNNNIAVRFLTDDSLAFEWVEMMAKGPVEKIKRGTPVDDLSDMEKYLLHDLLEMLYPKKHKIFMVTDSVLDKLDLLKIKRNREGWFDWRVFAGHKEVFYSFVIPPTKEWDRGGCLRLCIEDNVVRFAHICARKDISHPDPNYVQSLLTMFHVNRNTNEHASVCSTNSDVKNIYEFCYKLLCFVFLSENSYEVIEPGQSKGTRKTGKIKNDLPFQLTIINSKWNITSIRTDGFTVSGHFALRHVGAGRSQTRMVYIEPYQKNGYVRHAKKETL